MIIVKKDSASIITFENEDEIGVLSDLISDAREVRVIRKQEESILTEKVIHQLCSLFDENIKIDPLTHHVPLGRRIRSDLLKSGVKILHEEFGFPEFRRYESSKRRYSICVTAENYQKWESRSEPLFSFLLYFRRDIFANLNYQLCVAPTPELGVINTKGVIDSKYVISAERYGFKYITNGPRALSKICVSLSGKEFKAQLIKHLYGLMDVFWDEWVTPKPPTEQMVEIIKTYFGFEPFIGKNN